MSVTHRKTLQGIKKHLPTKVCQACSRLFNWRKKWARDWEHVSYCSKACKRNTAQQRSKAAVHRQLHSSK